MPLRVLQSVNDANEFQKDRAVDKLRRLVGGSLHSKRIAVWGLAFKAQTDDMRESPSLSLIAAIRSEGGEVVAHDPESRREAARRLGTQVELVSSAYVACEGADALVLMTDWNEYRSPDWARVRAALRHPVVVDMRNLYSPARMRALGFSYDSVGRPR